MLNGLALLHKRLRIRETMMFNYDTRRVKNKLQRDYWQDAISQVFVPLTCNVSVQDGFFGALSAKHIGNIQLVEIKGYGQHVERHASNIRHSHHDEILFIFLIEGQMGVQYHGREQCLSKGQFIFHDTQQPYDLYLNGQFNQLVLMFPREQFQQYFGRPDQLCGHAFGDGHPLKILLLNYAHDLFWFPEQASTELQQVVLHKFFDLLRYVVLDQVKDKTPRSSSHSMLVQVKHLILEHLNNSGLSIHDIAQDLRISSRYISKLFQQNETTFGRYVMQSRLQLAKKMLIQTNEHTHKINQIAYQCGFDDMSKFSREFRKHYGISPSMMRKIN